MLEDYADLRLLMVQLLKSRFDVQCLSAVTVKELDRAAEVLATDLIFLDLNLWDGETTASTRTLGFARSAAYAGRVIFFSGHPRNHPVLASVIADGVQILEKPLLFMS